MSKQIAMSHRNTYKKKVKVKKTKKYKKKK